MPRLCRACPLSQSLTALPAPPKWEPLANRASPANCLGSIRRKAEASLPRQAAAGLLSRSPDASETLSFARPAQTRPICQGLPLWGRWHREAMTERASPAEGTQGLCLALRRTGPRASPAEGMQGLCLALRKTGPRANPAEGMQGLCSALRKTGPRASPAARPRFRANFRWLYTPPAHSHTDRPHGRRG